MIQDLMRKHRRAILLFIVIVIAVPFVLFFGMPGKYRTHQTPDDNPIGTVGGLPIMESEFRRALNSLIQRKSTPDKPVTVEELDKSGEIDKLVQEIVDSKLFELESKKSGLTLDRTLLIEQMQKWPQFQTEDGKFDREAWNAWIDANRSKINWNELYKDIYDGVVNAVSVASVFAPARFDPREVDKKMENNYTKIRIKYAKISPKIEMTDEDLQKYYEEHKEVYRKPDTLTVEALKISLQPPIPDRVKEVYDKAVAGEDFAKLADEYSDIKTKNGGDMGWQKPTEKDPPNKKVIFDLKIGEVSPPIYAYGAFFIYKAEEDRIDPDTGVREVHARQIMIRASLSPEEKKQREDEAKSIAERANQEKDLQKIAQEKGYVFLKVGPFNRDTEQIDGVPNPDLYLFKNAFRESTKDGEYQVVTARDNIYVVKVLERIKGEISPFEEVKDRAKQDYITIVKAKEDYKKKVKEYADKILAEVKSLEDISKVIPELEIEVKEIQKPFTARDNLFSEGLMVSVSDIFKAIEGKEIGQIAGPVEDFAGDSYVVQLLEKTPPSDEDRKKMVEERDQMLRSEIAMAQSEMSEDYRLYLREQAIKRGIPIKINTSLISSIIGRDKTAQKGEEKKPEDTEHEKKGSGSTGIDANKLNLLIGD
ncbi:MAG: peptidyl-prolyl cis-trans isomerase [Candidatus Hydrogenedentes bacterium]|nr:peptidyl-prolyl cis-trans isomerase [Candidatus Hydrogenedentota bacterium]